MIVCPNCSHNEMEGAIYCSDCGAQLVFNERINLTNMQKTDSIETEPSVAEQPKDEPDLQQSFPDALVILRPIKKEALLHIDEPGEVILGRGSEGQSMVPDIDLHPYQAFDAGVSRLHAAMQVQLDRLMIVDLGSSNGTSINGVKIPPNEPHPLKNGDILGLGRFKMEVITKIGNQD